MSEDKKRKYQYGSGSGGGDAVYGLGLIGALVFYIQQASNFAEGVLGILQAFVWPAFVVYELLKSFL